MWICACLCLYVEPCLLCVAAVVTYRHTHPSQGYTCMMEIWERRLTVDGSISASVDTPWERAVAGNKVPYYIK